MQARIKCVNPVAHAEEKEPFLDRRQDNTKPNTPHDRGRRLPEALRAYAVRYFRSAAKRLGTAEPPPPLGRAPQP